MKKLMTIGTAVAAILVLGTAHAKPPAKPKPPVQFTSVDSDSDGRISREEVRYMDDLNGEFGKLDGNADNKLTPVEYSKWGRAAMIVPKAEQK